MEFIREVLGIISQYYSYLLSGVGYTMLIALIGTAAGFLIGLITGVIRTAPRSKNAVVRVLHKVVNAIIAVYIEVFRGTPMMVQAMVIYWGYAFLNDGATLPLIVHKIGLDPAVAASPMITTIVDAIALLVYFAIATALLGL